MSLLAVAAVVGKRLLYGLPLHEYHPLHQQIQSEPIVGDRVDILSAGVESGAQSVVLGARLHVAAEGRSEEMYDLHVSVHRMWVQLGRDVLVDKVDVRGVQGLRDTD